MSKEIELTLKELDEFIKAKSEQRDDVTLDLHEADIADALKTIRKADEERFYSYVKLLPPELLGLVLLELPEHYKEEIFERLPIEQMTEAINELDTDDAADLILEFQEINDEKTTEILDKLDEDTKDDIQTLIEYDDDQAGSLMQTELFKASLDETLHHAIERLKEQKKTQGLENIYQVFIVDHENKLLTTIPLEDLITQDFSLKFSDFAEKEDNTTVVYDYDNIHDVKMTFEKYNLAVVPVVDRFNHLLGRITSDDVYDIIEESATEQIYQLAGVDIHEEYENTAWQTAKKRGVWLFVNLFTAFAASYVVGQFSDTIHSLVALAVLMPIVASMGGNAGTQTLTVVVRQIALGEIDLSNVKGVIVKEILVALFNGLTFATLVGLIAYAWFGMPLLGLVIALSMVANLLAAGFFGSTIPLLFKKIDIDPALASSVMLTTVTDIFGFFSFLGLATIIIL